MASIHKRCIELPGVRATRCLPGHCSVFCPFEPHPADLSNIVDGTPITISVALNGEVRAPGAETIASAFFRDPMQVDNPDPLLGGSTITFDTVLPSDLASVSRRLRRWPCLVRRCLPSGRAGTGGARPRQPDRFEAAVQAALLTGNYWIACRKFCVAAKLLIEARRKAAQ